MIGLVLLAAAQSASAYVDCIRTRTDAFETSGELPNDVATAAIGACRALGPRDGSDQSEDVRTVLVARVVELRACRKHSVCNPSKIPWGSW